MYHPPNSQVSQKKVPFDENTKYHPSSKQEIKNAPILAHFSNFSE